MDRRAFLRAGGAAAVASLSGCLGGLSVGGLSEDDFDVGMSANAFLPEVYEIERGETVVWGNNGSRGHTVSAYESAIPEAAAYFASGGHEDLETAREAWSTRGSGNIPPGGTYEHTFSVPGRYDYLCIPHESKGMVGAIVVEG
jgi:plastocyanin